jgi:hypothetical protein
VATVSDDPSVEGYAERKEELRDRVARADSDAVALFAADKIAKVRELALLPVSTRTGGNNSVKLTHYRASLHMLRHATDSNALVECLDPELSRLTAPSRFARRREAPVTFACGPRRPGAEPIRAVRLSAGLDVQRSVWT